MFSVFDSDEELFEFLVSFFVPLSLLLLRLVPFSLLVLRFVPPSVLPLFPPPEELEPSLSLDVPVELSSALSAEVRSDVEVFVFAEVDDSLAFSSLESFFASDSLEELDAESNEEPNVPPDPSSPDPEVSLIKFVSVELVDVSRSRN